MKYSWLEGDENSKLSVYHLHQKKKKVGMYKLITSPLLRCAQEKASP